jgi:hypothetical protein
MSIETQPQTAMFHICFAYWSDADLSRPRGSYMGTFNVRWPNATIRGFPIKVFRVVMVLGSVLGAAGMVVLGLILGNRPDSMWWTLLLCMGIVGVVAATGWLLKHWQRTSVSVALDELHIDVCDQFDEPYVCIFLAGGDHLRLVPDPNHKGDFGRLREGLIELLSGQVANATR